MFLLIPSNSLIHFRPLAPEFEPSSIESVTTACKKSRVSRLFYILEIAAIRFSLRDTICPTLGLPQCLLVPRPRMLDAGIFNVSFLLKILLSLRNNKTDA